MHAVKKIRQSFLIFASLFILVCTIFGAGLRTSKPTSQITDNDNVSFFLDDDIDTGPSTEPILIFQISSSHQHAPLDATRLQPILLTPNVSSSLPPYLRIQNLRI